MVVAVAVLVLQFHSMHSSMVVQVLYLELDDHKDLKGFSKATINKKLPKDMKN
jgi:hypothetical protein